ncbi:MAG: tetratricopeptide repeat protein, partial [Flavisolibacter sp.]
MRRKIGCASLLLFLGLAVHAQDPKLLDSLNRAKEDTNKVHLLWDIGASIIFQDPQKAIPYFRQGIELSQKLQFEPGLEKCNAATSTAFAFNARHDSCLFYINKAIYFAKRIGNVNRLALVHLNRADVYKNMNDYSAALKDCDTAMIYADQSGNKDRQARIYNIISDVYELQSMYKPAMEYIQKAQVIYKEINNPQMTGQSYFDIATIHRKMGELDKGVQNLEMAIRIADSIQDIRNLSAFNGELAVLMIEKKNFREAEALATTALKYARQTGNPTQEAVIQTVFYNIYFKQNQFAKAIESGLAAYNLIKDKNDLGREQNIAGFLADAYEKTGNSKEAYHFLSTSKKLNDSLMVKRFSDETAKLQARFELTQKDKEILLLNKDKELQEQKLSRQRVLFTASVVLGILLLGGIILLVSRYRLRQRIKEMQLRNQIAADLHDEVGSSL